MKQLLLIVSLLLAMPAQADTYLDIHGLSKHFPQHNGYNEVNTGIGFTFNINNNSSFGFGTYRNSTVPKSRARSTHSEYIKYSLFKVFHKNIRAGATIGLATGYRWQITPTFVPLLSIGDIYRINFGAMPEIKGITPNVVFMSFQVKL